MTPIISPRRLYQSLAPTAGVVEVRYAEESPLTDDRLAQVTIHRGRGGADPFTGVTPSTATIVTPTQEPLRGAQPVTVRLTDALTSQLIGHTLADRSPQARFAGRVGIQAVTHRGPGRYTTTTQAASRTALLPDALDYIYTPAKGNNLGLVTGQLLAPQGQTHPAPVVLGNQGYYGQVELPPAGAPVAQLLPRFTAETGIMVRDTRLGRPEVLHIPYLEAAAQTTLADHLPILAGHTLAPSSWRQGRELDPKTWHIAFTNGAGQVQTEGAAGNPLDPVVTLDRTWVRYPDYTQPARFIAARRATEWGTLWALEALEFDLLHLLTSPGEYARRTAGQLLGLEVYEWVGLAGDWPEPLRRLHLVTGIDETITATSWRLKLSLAPYPFVTGQPSPVVPPRAWDSHTHPWPTEPNTWN